MTRRQLLAVFAAALGAGACALPAAASPRLKRLTGRVEGKFSDGPHGLSGFTIKVGRKKIKVLVDGGTDFSAVTGSYSYEELQVLDKVLIRYFKSGGNYFATYVRHQ